MRDFWPLDIVKAKPEVPMKSLPLSFSLVLVAGSHAHAHWGHVGELAGHGHLIGLGAVVAAGALAAILAKGVKKKDEPVSEPSNDEQEHGCEDGEPA
jgi:hypothetical protein